jgi:non-heme chloroperoxidase
MVPFLTVGEENSDAIDLYFEDHGSGRPVVLIHGYPLSGTAWEKQVPVLMDQGYRVITYDRRGFGRSSQPSTGYEYDTFAADLNMVMSALDIRDAVLVGHSMGTGEVTRYLSSYGSARVDRAVFVSPLMPYLLKTADNPEGVDGALFDGIMQNIKQDRYAYLAMFLTQFYNRGIRGARPVSDEVYRANWYVAANASPVGTLACVSAWLTDFRADLAAIDVPSLIVQGDGDQILPFEATGKRLPEMLAGSRLVCLPGAPHGLAWTHADELNHELVTFMK